MWVTISPTPTSPPPTSVEPTVTATSAAHGRCRRTQSRLPDAEAPWRTHRFASSPRPSDRIRYPDASNHRQRLPSRTGLRAPASKPSMRKAIAVGTVLLTLAAACSRGQAADTAAPTAVSESPPATQASDAAPTADFAAVSELMSDAIAAQRLPGAVVVIGHGGKVVFHHAYGSRKLAGEPGLDGSPAPAEPMTEDTIFDIASLTKGLATATTVMQLYEQGKVRVRRSRADSICPTSTRRTIPSAPR